MNKNHLTVTRLLFCSRCDEILATLDLKATLATV